MCVLRHLRLHRSAFEELSPEREHHWLAAVTMVVIPGVVLLSVVASLLRMA